MNFLSFHNHLHLHLPTPCSPPAPAPPLQVDLELEVKEKKTRGLSVAGGVSQSGAVEVRWCRCCSCAAGGSWGPWLLPKHGRRCRLRLRLLDLCEPGAHIFYPGCRA